MRKNPNSVKITKNITSDNDIISCRICRFYDSVTAISGKAQRSGRDERRLARVAKRKQQKERYEKGKKKKKSKVAVLNTSKSSVTEKPQKFTKNVSKPTQKRKRPDDNESTVETGRKRPKTVNPEKNANYIKPAFDGKFNTIEALAKNLFDDMEVPTLPEQREVHREELFASSGPGFDTLELHSHLVGNVTTIFGHTSPTVVQSKAIPEIIKNTDTLIRSQTGSGGVENNSFKY